VPRSIGIKADIGNLGKGYGGGLPVGALCSKR